MRLPTPRARRALVLLSVPAVAVAIGSVAPGLPAISTGVHLSDFMISIEVAPACGSCHFGPSAQATNLVVSLDPSARSLSPSETIQVTTSATGGQSGPGGFNSQVQVGRFASTSADTQTNLAGDSITHTGPDPTRDWTYDYTAPMTPGLVELYTVVNTSDGGFTGNFSWGFHGVDPLVNTPVRLFVNAPGVTAVGSSCEGGNGNYPVLGCPESPTVGSQTFGYEVHGCVPGTTAFWFFGFVPATVPLDLTPIATGCEMWVPIDAPNPVFTTTATPMGSIERAEGIARLDFPLPPFLPPGLPLTTQAVLLDFDAPQALPIVVTNAVTLAIQP